MINITLRSGKYSKKQLDNKLSRYIEERRDIDLFIEAMIKTGQITKEKRTYVLAKMKSRTLKYPKYYSLPSFIYGGGGRVGVRGGKDWIDERGFPSGMSLSKAFVDGKWVDIKEKPQMKLVKGRSPMGGEAWRAQVPVEIQRKYGLTPDATLKVRVDIITKQFFSNLRLWGYQYMTMLSYGETKVGASARFLELGGQSFVNSIKKDISDTISRDQKRIKNIILKLLSDADSEYYGLYEKTEDVDNVSENIKAIPLIEKSLLIAKVELRDLKNGRVILDWNTITEKSKIPKPSDFKLKSHINEEISASRGETATSRKFTNTGGF